MSANRAHFPVATMARVLGVAASGYYAWRRRVPSARARADAALKERIGTIHAASRGTYGAPRIHAELRVGGACVSRRRVARLMRAMGLTGVSRRKGVRTTRRDPQSRPAPDLVERHFQAEAPDTLWVADITYVPLVSGAFVYLAVVLDVFSRRVVGWAMGHHLHTMLILGALNMAASQRDATGVIHHSDQGSQYTSFAFGKRCQELGVRPSMGSVGDCYDNAMAESFFATLECELLERSRFRTLTEARLAIFDFIEGFYNTRRRHSAIDYDSPVNYERRFHSLPNPESDNLSTETG
jgi:putative transposase